MGTLFTIGFTKLGAERFFETLKAAGVARVLDVRLRNEGQLAGFSKKPDLEYFLKTIVGADYIHAKELAPTDEMLDKVREDGDWDWYIPRYEALIAERRVEREYPRSIWDGGCLLCTEPKGEPCHRVLAAEYLRAKLGLAVRHLP